MTRNNHFRAMGRFMLLTGLALLTGQGVQAQQAAGNSTYVGRYDAYVGFSGIYAPFVNDLNQQGVGTQFGVNNTRWLASGFDYSAQSGSTQLTPSLLPTALQMELAAILPPGYSLSVPTHVNIQTFTAGPQLVYRHFVKETFFIHPVLSAFRVSATPHPTDAVSTAVVGALEQQGLVPTSGVKLDWTGGYGVGGGTDVNFSKHFSARFTIDIAHTHPMNDLLANGGWVYRFSVGPAIHFGHNVH